jgi:hypothetical protein
VATLKAVALVSRSPTNSGKPRLRCDSGAEPGHLLVDSTGMKLCGAEEWLLEKHSTRTRHSWRRLHIGIDTETGDTVVAELTTNDVGEASQVGPLLGQVAGPVASVGNRCMAARKSG